MNKHGSIPPHGPGKRYTGKRPESGDAGAWRRLQEMSQHTGEAEVEAERLSRGATVFPAEYPELSDSPDEMF